MKVFSVGLGIWTIEHWTNESILFVEVIISDIPIKLICQQGTRMSEKNDYHWWYNKFISSSLTWIPLQSDSIILLGLYCSHFLLPRTFAELKYFVNPVSSTFRTIITSWVPLWIISSVIVYSSTYVSCTFCF